MKKFILASLLLSSSASLHADYVLVFPIENVEFVKIEWVSHEPLFTEWVTQPEIYDCINWTPLQESKYIEVSFTQTTENCKQNQTRTKQERQIHTTTGEIRNVGSAINENQTITVSSSRQSQGTSNSWESFADYKGLPKDWNNLNWGGRNLTTLPSGNYPVKNVSGNLYLHNNPFTNVNSLTSIESINGYLGLYDSSLTNVDGLINLRTVGQTFSIRTSPNLANINGLANMVVNGTINIDKTYKGPKLPASSRFCSMNAANKFATTTTYASKTQLCL